MKVPDLTHSDSPHPAPCAQAETQTQAGGAGEACLVSCEGTKVMTSVAAATGISRSPALSAHGVGDQSG